MAAKLVEYGSDARSGLVTGVDISNCPTNWQLATPDF